MLGLGKDGIPYYDVAIKCWNNDGSSTTQRLDLILRLGMHLGVILPTTKLYGGVKRFLELGNLFIRRGHSFTVFSPEGVFPAWFDFRGKVEQINNLGNHSFDAIFITELCYLDLLLNAKARMKIFYCVSQKAAEELRRVLAHQEITVFVNSSNLFGYIRRKYGIEPFKAIGGVDCDAFMPRRGENPASLPPQIKKQDDVITILAYGRLHRRTKGTALVVKACERLHRQGYKINMLLFDTPVDERARRMIKEFSCKAPFEFIIDHPVSENYKIFQRADIFVAAERKAGWSNTCAEAMAGGIAVVATRAGTDDMIEHSVTGLRVFRNSISICRAIRRLIDSPELRKRIAQNGRERIQRFTWSNLADTILRLVELR